MRRARLQLLAARSAGIAEVCIRELPRLLELQHVQCHLAQEVHGATVSKGGRHLQVKAAQGWGGALRRRCHCRNSVPHMCMRAAGH
jgi:hypothetical protein